MANTGVAPIDVSTAVGQVRLLDGDTDPTNVLNNQGTYLWYSDAEINGLVSLLGTPQHAAIHVLRMVAMSPAMILKKWVSADLSVDGPAITRELEVAIDKIEKTIAAGVLAGSADGFKLVSGGDVHGGPGLFGLAGFSFPYRPDLDQELVEDPLHPGYYEIVD